MRIIQIRDTLTPGDGVGNTVLMMDRVLSSGFNSIIATRLFNGDRDLYPQVVCFKDLAELDVQAEDIVIFHFCGWEELALQILNLNCKRIMLYHNVTYPYFFIGVNNKDAYFCANGQRYIRSIHGEFLKIIAPSHFSYNELVNMGWKKKDVCFLPHPVSLEKKDVESRVDGERSYRQFLSVGRIVSNKKIEDIIRIFDFYRSNYYSNAQLKLVGSINNDAYYRALKQYIEINDFRNIEFLSHISDEELDRLYRDSDIYLCMSEHEGFCIPLIEAMSYEIPVLAYNATAVHDTMGDAGILLESKDPEYVCEKINRIFEDELYRTQLIEGQNRHIDSYIRDDYEKKLFNIIEEVRAIASYSYNDSNIEFYKILLEEIEKSGEKYLQEQIQRLKGMGKPIVLYGAGKVGTMLLEYFSNNDLPIVAVCDAGKCGGEIEGKMIMSPNECTQKYPDAIYIISVQNSGSALEISDNLHNMGVPGNKVLRYSNSDKTIVL